MVKWGYRSVVTRAGRSGNRSRMLIKNALLGLAVVTLGALCVMVLPRFLNLTGNGENLVADSSQCYDAALNATAVDTTLSVSGDSEQPSFSSDTTFTVPKDWREVTSLTSSPDDARYRNAVECFLPGDSQAYRPSPPTVSVGDSDQAKQKKEQLVGDHITLEDYAENANGDPGYPPSDLGVWYLSYDGLPSDGCANQPAELPKSYLLAVLCPVSDAAANGQWTVHLDLQGADIVSSSSKPVQYSVGTSAIWKISGFKNGDGFWVELKPDRPSGMYLALQGWHSDVVPLVTGMIGWTIFFSLLLLGARRARAAVNFAGIDSEQSAIRALTGVSVCALVACVLATVADAIWALGSDGTPHADYARVESIAVFVLVAAFSLQIWEWAWHKFIVLLIIAVLSAVAYFGPDEIQLATIPAPFGITNRWQVMGYVNHLLIGVALVAVLIAGALSVGKKAAEQVTPALTAADNALRASSLRENRRPATATALIAVVLASLLAAAKRAGDVTTPRISSSDAAANIEPPNYWPNRPARWAIGVLCGMAVALQWLRIAYDQWDHRRLFPGAPAPMEEMSHALLTQFPWFPDFILHWLPALLFYPAIICAVLVLMRIGQSEANRGCALIRQTSPAVGLTALVFAVGVVGIYGSYRSVQVPIAFLVSLALVRIVARGTDRLEKEIQYAKEREGETELGRLQYALLRKSPNESKATAQSGGKDRAPGRATKRWWPRHGSRQATTNEASSSKYSDQELALAIGPRIGWWRNALYATKIAALLAIIFVAYDVFRNYQNGTFSGLLQNNDGFFGVLQWILSEMLTWTAAGFTLGALWPLLPGRRGVYKGLALSAVAIVSSTADILISRAFGQSTWDIASWSVLILSFIEIIAIILDISTLKKAERGGWEFIDYLRLRDTRWVATYGVVAIVVIFTIIQQIRSGQPISNVPASVISSILKAKVTP